MKLFLHFFTVAFYSIWVLFTHPRQVGSVDGKPVYARPRPDDYPLLAVKSVQVVCLSPSLPPPLAPFAVLDPGTRVADACLQFWTACVVFMPLLWSEFRL